MINSNIYNYIDVLDKAADASNLRGEILNNNIANVDTPNYKRKDVQFETLLQAAIGGGGTSLEDTIADINTDLSQLNGFTYTDNSSLSYRLDGNNVNIDTENAYLAENQIRYNALIEQMGQEFGRYNTVLS